MEAPPASALEVAETQFLLQFLVVPLDAPAQLRQLDQPVEGDVFRNAREPELGRLLLVRGPLDEQPLLVPGRISVVITMGSANSHACEARAQEVGKGYERPVLLGGSVRG